MSWTGLPLQIELVRKPSAEEQAQRTCDQIGG